MRKHIYSKLAAIGIMKNSRTYVPYLLTCIGMVMMYYILEFLMVSGEVAALEGGPMLQEMLSFGSGVFAVFLVIFLFYTNSFLIRSRKQEFGLYNILGMGKQNLVRILVWETVFMAAVSLAGGIFCGILFSKLAELCVAFVMNESVGLAFHVEIPCVIEVLKLFAVVFVLILINALLQIARTKPIDLLHGGLVGEKPPKANWLMALVGLIMLAAAYYIAVRIEDPTSALLAFFVAVVMVIAATYLLFISGSVVFCRLLQKNKRYYYQPGHFVSVSSMMYRMKRNGAGLASICVLSTMVLVMLSAVTCMYTGNEERLMARYIRQVELYEYTDSEDYIGQTAGEVSSVLEQQGETAQNILDYRFLSIGGYFDGDQVILNQEKLVNELGVFDYSKIRDLYLVPLEDYNRITGENETLGSDEVMVYSKKTPYEYETITLEGCDTWKVKKTAETFTPNGSDMASVIGGLYIFVPDVQFAQRVDEAQKEIYENNASGWIHYYGFDISGGEDKQQTVAEQIQERIYELSEQDDGYPSVMVNCRARERGDFYALYGGLFILGVLLGIVFLGATILIMYYKQVTEGYEDQAKFTIMQKVGMTKREIRRSIRSQMFTVFLVPLLLAGVHTAFAFPIVQKLLVLFGIFNAKPLIMTMIICFLIFTLFYTLVYLSTSRVYYRIVSGAKNETS